MRRRALTVAFGLVAVVLSVLSYKLLRPQVELPPDLQFLLEIDPQPEHRVRQRKPANLHATYLNDWYIFEHPAYFKQADLEIKPKLLQAGFTRSPGGPVYQKNKHAFYIRVAGRREGGSYIVAIDRREVKGFRRWLFTHLP